MLVDDDPCSRFLSLEVMNVCSSPELVQAGGGGAVAR